ncbi:olee1-like protein-like [Dorcoceras hygrometricum]|uniref:Olee1-like protein-like n=1 Tax=Dorcoceras hygrometricum TaxID=472368 RepID=A0A2Z7CUU7_9LAMI|nr:olee1-like protein-like [Dorcoceras hygrometricum]
MEKTLLVCFTLCVLPAIVTAVSPRDPLLLKGSVYCDTCRCGFQTDASKHLVVLKLGALDLCLKHAKCVGSGAVVRIECRSRASSQLTYLKDGVTDSSGNYNILVESDRGDDYCDAVLVKSLDPECSEANQGRDRARVILTSNNGMTSNTRFANPMGFLKNRPLASCSKILQKYQEAED